MTVVDSTMPSSTLERDLGLSLFVQGAEMVAQFYSAIERGVVDDVLACYRRLLEAIGRRMSQEGAMTTIFPLGMMRSVGGISTDRIALAQIAIGPALRNISAIDAERHWRAADAAIKGVAQAEARRWLGVVEALKREPLEEGEAQDARSEAIADAAGRAVYYGTLSRTEGWL